MLGAESNVILLLLTPLIQQLGWLPIEQLIELETVKVEYKALHNEAPPYMKELFPKLSNTQCTELRNSSTDLHIPRLRTSMDQKSLGYRGVGVRFWNNLIDEAKEARKYFAFKRVLSKRLKQ